MRAVRGYACQLQPFALFDTSLTAEPSAVARLRCSTQCERKCAYAVIGRAVSSSVQRNVCFIP